jgi:sugar O-acyltransferase (sialic acid O-acetyltransferase NeuD family)
MDAGPIVIVGDSEFAEIAYEYFTHDSEHEVIGFAVEEEFRSRDELFGLPVVAFQEVERHFDPRRCGAYVAITYIQLNRVRRRLLDATRAKGFHVVSYVSSHAFVWHNVEIGENVFVFENNVIQHHARIGDNVILWSGNHIGHRTVVSNDCFVSSHVVVSGYCDIGERCFFGVNSCVAHGINVGSDCVIGAGAVVTHDVDSEGVYVGNPARRVPKSSFETFGVERDEA